MAIDVSEQYNGGILPDILLLLLLLTQCHFTIGEPVCMPRRGLVFAAYDPTSTFRFFFSKLFAVTLNCSRVFMMRT